MQQQPFPKLAVALLSALAFFASACTSSDPADEETESQGDKTLDACMYAPDDANCDVLEVPENYDEPDGQIISLPYVILPALGPEPSAVPLVYLAGGPGGSTISAVAEFADFSELREDRDMIFLEQRGTGLAEPFLGCEESESVSVKSCYEAFLAAGVDPGQYTTMGAAQDLMALRQELGIERWHLLGISYGTTLAMISMRTDPEGTASVILDSPTAPDVIIYNADVESQLNNVSRVLADCEANPDCGSRYPDLFATHLATFEELKSEPWTVEDPDMVSLFETETVDAMIYQAITMELSVDDPGSLPGYIVAVANRDEEALLKVAPLGWGDSQSGDSQSGDSQSGDSQSGDSADAVDACVADPECSAEYPDIEADYEAVLTALGDGPWELSDREIIDNLGQDSLGPRDLEWMLPGAIEITGRPDFVGRLVAIFADRDELALSMLIEEVIAISEGSSEDGPRATNTLEAREYAFGFNLSVYCAEEAPFFDLDTNPLETTDEWPDEITMPMLDGVIDDCESWDVPPSEPADVAQVGSDIPTLIMAGQYDHLTPFRQGEIAAAGLSQSQLLEVPGAGHGLISDTCVRTVMADFLRSAEGTSACLDAIPPIEFR